MDLKQRIFAAVAGGDARAFLAAMLQRIEPEIGQVGRFRMAVDGEHAALLVQFIEGEALLVRTDHAWCSSAFE